MKKLAMFLLLAIGCSTAVIAQDSAKTDHKKMGHMGGHMKMKDCVMMKGGKLMVMKGGKTTDMTESMNLSNGSVVNTDGTLTMSDGTSKQLKNGDCVYMDGKMMNMKKTSMKKKSVKKTSSSTM